ncbi:hypothetical protein ACGP04_00910 [Piscirickettsia salmonis]|uniref:hypothetical protein n=1 Tax=Piscirickettsia salmonis TaxID=1238 RepID=UPI003750433B
MSDDQLKFDDDDLKRFQVELDEKVLNKTDKIFQESLRNLANRYSMRNQINYQTTAIENRKNLKELYPKDFLKKYETKNEGYDIRQLVLDEGRELDQQLDDKKKKPFIHYFSNLHGDPWAYAASHGVLSTG